MKITIKGAEHKLNFGIHFLREMDKKYFSDDSGIRYGLGAQMAFFKLENKDTVMLFDVLKVALAKDFTLTDEAFDDFYDALSEEEIDQLFEDLVKNLEQQPATSRPINNFKKAMKTAAAQEN